MAYLRVARDDQPEAIARQRDACERIAVKHGCTLVREYVDAGCPARLDQQVGLQKLLNDLTVQRDVTAVVIWNFARLAHDLTQLEEVISRLRACGAEVVTMTGVEVAERFHQAQRMKEAFQRQGVLEVPEGGGVE